MLRLAPNEAVCNEAIGLSLTIRHGFPDCLELALAMRQCALA